MNTVFLSKNYLALVLIEFKNKFFQENFTTLSEIGNFSQYLQKEINGRGLDIVIKSDYLSQYDFIIMNGVVIKGESCCYNLELLSDTILNLLYDEDFIINFFTCFENKKIELLNSKVNRQKYIKKI